MGVEVLVLVLVLGGVCLCVCKRQSFCFSRSEYLTLFVGVVCEASSCVINAFFFFFFFAIFALVAKRFCFGL